ncbi:GDSL esterase/lipase 1-like [Hibiscus syriacus]|uniref:GDSL esterase/lipase 1-like n=1 Tax=Hibiscus syriacus TaxID=106335 RepID=A0A6A2X1P8_HIBSY|nr:GDSL esterase/lipase 1-like [Hibiscus syriacus]
MMAKSSALVCCFLSLEIFLNSVSCHNHLLPENHVALFIFGDSILDSGNNNYLSTIPDFKADFWPYGETFFEYPTGRFSDGRLIPDFIAEFAGLLLIPAYLNPGNSKFTNGVNFASGGAGALVETHQGLVIDLETQIKYFKKAERSLRKELGVEETKKLLFDAVYFIGIGGNDYLTKPSGVTDEEFVSMVIGNLTAAFNEIYKKGGRKFGLTNMMPLDGFKYGYYDFYESITERLHNPSKYGFKKTTACCGSGEGRGVYSCGGKRGVSEFVLFENPDEYLFFDAYHYTEKAYEQFTELMWNGTADIIWPYNLKTLFQATISSDRSHQFVVQTL